MRKLLVIALLFVGITACKQQNNEFKLEFKNTSIGKLTDEALSKESNGMDWTYLNDNASVVEDVDRGKVIEVKYPKGNVGPNTIGFSGSQFIKNLKPATEYYLDYYVKFEEGFDFRKGGKLPGLTSGGSKYTGGNHPDNGEGWSTRYMWVANGEIILYFYYMDMSHKYGDIVKMNVSFETGKWYRLTQRIKLNEDDDKNGILQIWVDGTEVVNQTDIRFRLGEKGMIDTFYFSTFYGGATSDWAPQNDSFTRFDRFVVSAEKPDF